MKALICPRCGEPLKKAGDGYICPTCGTQYEKDDAEEALALLQKTLNEAKIERLANARRLLWKAVHAEYPSEEDVKDGAKAVLQIVQDDPMALYYLHSHDGDPHECVSLLSKMEVDSFDANEVVDWALRSLQPRLVSPLKDFADRHFSGRERSTMITAIEDEAARVDEGIYTASLPRKVFLAYSSADMPRVIAVMEFLEENGFSCFAAFRNLRHGRGAKENYLDEIQKAIGACKVVVFLSSNASRSVNCDALSVELPYLNERFPEKPRIEYILDDYPARLPLMVRETLKEAFPEQEHCRYEEDLYKRVKSALAAKKPAKEKTGAKEAAEAVKKQQELEAKLASLEAGLAKQAEQKASEEAAEAAKKQKELEEKLASLEEGLAKQASQKAEEAELRKQIEEEYRQKNLLDQQAKKESAEDFITYGEYPNSEEKDPVVLAVLDDERKKKKKKTAESPYLELDGKKYAYADGRYFLVEPIRWKILKKEGEYAIAISHMVLDASVFDGSRNIHRFADSYLRQWLNKEFLGAAFPDFGERLAPVAKEDYVTLLAKEDWQKPDSGFSSDSDRLAKISEYAKCRLGVDPGFFGPYWTQSSMSLYSQFSTVTAKGGLDSLSTSALSGLRPIVKIALAEKKSVSVDRNKPTLDGDVLLYGECPQTRVKNAALLEVLKTMKPKGKSPYIVFRERRYKEEWGKYFLVEPIRWIVLSRWKSKDGKEAVSAIAERALCKRPFSSQSNNYQSSTIRAYLLGDFIQDYFPDKGKYLYSENGVDKVRLPSVDLDRPGNLLDDHALRICLRTDYLGESSPCFYWTSSPHSQGIFAWQFDSRGSRTYSNVKLDSHVRPLISVKLQ